MRKERKVEKENRKKTERKQKDTDRPRYQKFDLFDLWRKKRSLKMQRMRKQFRDNFLVQENGTTSFSQIQIFFIKANQKQLVASSFFGTH